MQRTVYECDGCGKAIGNTAHITLVLQTNHPGTGVAVPPGTEVAGIGRSGWKTIKLPRNFIHLHFGCVEKYFRGIEGFGDKKKKAKK